MKSMSALVISLIGFASVSTLSFAAPPHQPKNTAPGRPAAPALVDPLQPRRNYSFDLKVYPYDRLLADLQKKKIALRPAKCIFKDTMDTVTLEGHKEEISVTDRNFTSYANRLNLTQNDLKNKRILDVGAGFSDFVDVSAENFNSDAVAIDLVYDKYPINHLPKECQEIYRKRRFAMDATKLKFPNNYFDLVASNTMFNWFFYGSADTSKESIDLGIKALEEMIRVTAAGGEIRTTDIPNPKDVIKAGKPFAEYYAKEINSLLKKYDGVIQCSFSIEGETYSDTRIRKLKPIPNAELPIVIKE